MDDSDYKRELKRLEDRKKSAEQKCNYKELSDVLVELGEVHRMNGMNKKAIFAYQAALRVSNNAKSFENICLCCRNLGELASEEDNYDTAIAQMLNYMKWARKLNSVHEIQLAFHQYAWVLYGSYVKDSEKYHDNLLKALMFARNGIEYLKKNAAAIDKDKNALKSAGDSKMRQAGLDQLISDIYFDVDDLLRAKQHSNAAYNYYISSGDVERQYICLFNRLKLTSSSNERIVMLKNLARLAKQFPEKNAKVKQAEVQFALAKEELNLIDVKNGLDKLWDLYSKRTQTHFFGEEEEEELCNLLFFAYKLQERLKVAESVETSRNRRMKIYEKLGDEASDNKLIYLAMKMYRKMAVYCDTKEQRRLVEQSLAETANDLKDYSKALEHYQAVLALETQLNYSSNKLAETRIVITELKSKDNKLSFSDKKASFEETLNQCRKMSHKKMLLQKYKYFLEKLNDANHQDLLASVKARLEEYKSLSQESENSDEEREEPVDEFYDEFEGKSRAEFEIEIKGVMKERKEAAKFKKDRNIAINKEGETYLHEAARMGNLELLKKLVDEYHYSVNVEDYAGWTPLSEAVVHQKADCVRFLLSKGANVNTQSNDNAMLFDENQEPCSTGKITPLMEACLSGDMVIIELLFNNGARVTDMNEDGWTAVDLLRDYMNRHQNDLSANIIRKIQDLLKKMEDKQRIAGFPVRSTPPSIRSSQKGILNLKFSQGRRQKRVVDENKDNLNEYKGAMNTLRRNRKIHDKTADSVNNPADELDYSDPLLENDFEEDTMMLSNNSRLIMDEEDDDFRDKDDELFRSLNAAQDGNAELPTTSTQFGSPVPFEPYPGLMDENVEDISRKRSVAKSSEGVQNKRKKINMNSFFR